MDELSLVVSEVGLKRDYESERTGPIFSVHVSFVSTVRIPTSSGLWLFSMGYR